MEVGPKEQVGGAWGAEVWAGEQGESGWLAVRVTLIQPRARQPATRVCTSSSSNWSRKHRRAWERQGKAEKEDLASHQEPKTPTLALPGALSNSHPLPESRAQ